MAKSLRKAINRMCRECIVDPGAAGSSVVQVELCESYDCPLWMVRPTRSRTAKVKPELSAAVREFYSISESAAIRILADPYQRPLG